jgi:hypothetical protein
MEYAFLLGKLRRKEEKSMECFEYLRKTLLGDELLALGGVTSAYSEIIREHKIFVDELLEQLEKRKTEQTPQMESLAMENEDLQSQLQEARVKLHSMSGLVIVQQ